MSFCFLIFFHLCSLEPKWKKISRRQATDAWFLLISPTCRFLSTYMNYMRFGSIFETGCFQASSFSWVFFAGTGLIIFFPCKEEFCRSIYFVYFVARLVLPPKENRKFFFNWLNYIELVYFDVFLEEPSGWLLLGQSTFNSYSSPSLLTFNFCFL